MLHASSGYVKMKRRQQEEFNDLPLGFAFSDGQFTNMMVKWGLDPDKDLDKLYRLPGGGYIQKKDAELLHQLRTRHDAEMETAIAEDTTGDGFIYQMFLEELADHEYGYTGDVEETLEALGYTYEQILADKRLHHGLEKAANKLLNKEIC